MIQHLEPADIPYLLWETGGMRPAPMRAEDPDMRASYEVLARHHALRHLFWEDAEHAEVLTYEYYARYFSRHQAFFVVAPREDGTTQLDGMFWLSSFVPGWHTHMGVWFRFKCRGVYSRMVTARFLAWLFERQRLQTVWAMTPWPAAVAYGLACGAEKPEAVLPSYARIDGKVYDAYVLRLTRAQWEAHHGL